MEEPAEKTSYTLNNYSVIDVSDANKTESFALIEEDALMLAKTPMLEKEKEKSAEILVEPNESTALTDEKKETIKDEKDVTQTNLPTKNRFMRLFDRKSNKSEPTEQNGNGVSQPATTEGAAPTAPKRRFIPAIKLQNPFAKKSETAVPAAKVDDEKAVTPIEAIELPPLVATEGEEKKGKNHMVY